MRLTKILIRNFRSFWSSGDEFSAQIDLGTGVNYITGGNNAGKSNILRAVSMALDSRNVGYQPLDDVPRGTESRTSVVLEFSVDPLVPNSTRVGALLGALDEYERKISGFVEPSLASKGIVRYRVDWDNAGRPTHRFLTNAVETTGKFPNPVRPLECFRAAVRLIEIKSGEDLDSLLQGRLKSMLGRALGEEYRGDMRRATDARDAYVASLNQVLTPIGRYLEEHLPSLVHPLRGVRFEVNIPPVEDAIRDARILIDDAISTPLNQKGTGVRGALLLLLLKFVADHNTENAVVFCIEEPESFLHPEAHAFLGRELKRIVEKPGASTLVTTHSPFIFRSEEVEESSSVFLVRRSAEGRSTVCKEQSARARTDLLGSSTLATLLGRIDAVPQDSKLVLVVEGWTDKRYLELAANRLGIDFGNVSIEVASGAAAAVVQAIALRAIFKPDRLVVALFDGDRDGNSASTILVDKCKWQKSTEVLSYTQWVSADGVDVEAEDLFGNDILDDFLAVPGHGVFLSEKKRRPKENTWHYGLTQDGKPAFVAWLEQSANPGTFEKWRGPLESILKLIRDADARAARKVSQGIKT